MIHNFYAVKDNLTGKFYNPIAIDTDEEAKRAFKSYIKNTPIWKDNPSDFTMHKVFSFNDENGETIQLDDEIANGRSVIDEWQTKIL